ncbi:lamin tail domain-containing protein [Parapedobacter sp. 2B3]
MAVYQPPEPMKNNLFLSWVAMALFPVFVAGHALRMPEGAVARKPGIAMTPDDTTGAIFYDDFAGGPWNKWLGDTASFEVVDGLLTLQGRARPPKSIAFPCVQVRNTVWEAGLEVSGGFSASNYVRIYLAATTPSLQEPQWGYHLQIDGSETYHVYRLWRQKGTTRKIVFQSAPMPHSTAMFQARVRVTCTYDGYWQLFVDEGGNGPFKMLSGKSDETTVSDDTYLNSGYSGYFVSFSPVRAHDFKLDYFLVKPLDPSAGTDTSDIPEASDILINEVLSDPKSGGVDFLEIYNYSNKTIDLSGVHIAQVGTNGIVGNRQAVSDHPLFIHPNEYKVLTRRPATIKQHYPNATSSAMIAMASLPDFNKETGGVVIYGNRGTIDSLFYTPQMQSPFITSHRGISLERQHFSEPTLAPRNFRSAAVAIGGATPGYRNSQFPDGVLEEHVFLASKTFSPDNDGFEDRLEINYRFPESGFMATVDIYTDQGRLAKRLVRNQSIATQGTIYWDGLSDANTRLPTGMYIAVVEVYNAVGVRKVYRKSFVLVARM